MKKTILIVVGVILVLVLGFGTLVYFGYNGISSRAPTDAEKSMLITLDVLESYGYTNQPQEATAIWSAKVNIDGSTELEYEYELESETDYLYIVSDVNLEATEKDARDSFKIGINAYKLGLKIGGATAEKKPNLFTLGDERYSAQIMIDGDPFGNLVVVRHGRIIHSLILMGLYFDEKEDLESLFFQALENSAPEKFGAKK